MSNKSNNGHEENEMNFEEYVRKKTGFAQPSIDQLEKLAKEADQDHLDDIDDYVNDDFVDDRQQKMKTRLPRTLSDHMQRNTENLLSTFLNLEKHSKNLAVKADDFVRINDNTYYLFKINGVITVSPEMLKGEVGTYAQNMKNTGAIPNYINKKNRTRKIVEKKNGVTSTKTDVLSRWLAQKWLPFVDVNGEYGGNVDSRGALIDCKTIWYGGYYVDPYVCSAVARHVFHGPTGYQSIVHKGVGRSLRTGKEVLGAASPEAVKVAIQKLAEKLSEEYVPCKRLPPSFQLGVEHVRQEFEAFLKEYHSTPKDQIRKKYSPETIKSLQQLLTNKRPPVFAGGRVTMKTWSKDDQEPINLSKKLHTEISEALQRGEVLTDQHHLYQTVMDKYDHLPKAFLDLMGDNTVTHRMTEHDVKNATRNLERLPGSKVVLGGKRSGIESAMPAKFQKKKCK